MKFFDSPLWSAPLRDLVTAALQTIPVRATFALGCLALHLVLLVWSGQRFGSPFNAAPGQPPAFINPASDPAPQRWNRLLVSRWDAGHYTNLALRGYRYCPPRPVAQLPAPGPTCDLAFFPTYGLVGRLLTLGGAIGVDWALFGVSLLASFVFLFLWTGPALTERLGVGPTYLALVLLNLFTTGFTLVTAQTEPLTLVFTLGSFVALRRRWPWLAALLAGAASAMRVTGVAASIACAAALIVAQWNQQRARPALDRMAALRTGAQVILCSWGLLALMAYYGYRFNDPLAYVHAHHRVFRHEASMAKLLWPDADWIAKSIEQPLHEGVWLIAALLWFLIGRREAMSRFPPAERAFWYGLIVVAIGIPAVGSASMSFVGMNRYLLLAFPLFLAMAAVLRTRPALIVLWLLISVWHYWNVDLCEYTGGPGNRTLQVCHAPHWVGRI